MTKFDKTQHFSTFLNISQHFLMVAYLQVFVKVTEAIRNHMAKSEIFKTCQRTKNVEVAAEKSVDPSSRHEYATLTFSGMPPTCVTESRIKKFILPRSDPMCTNNNREK